MRKLKQHIAFFLLVGFLFPQAAKSMHYFLVDHKFSKEGSAKNIKPDFDYHSCTYHLNGISGIVPTGSFKKEGLTIHFAEKQKFCSLINYVQEPDFNFNLRGPPEYFIFKRNDQTYNKNI